MDTGGAYSPFGYYEGDSRQPGRGLPSPWFWKLEQPNIVGEAAEAAQQVAIIVIAALVFALNTMQEHFSADDCGCASECAHCHAASLPLEHSAHAALLSLHGHCGGGGNDSGEAGATTGAIGGANGG